LLPLVLVLAIAAGVMTTLLASQLRPVFFNASDLRAKFQLPMLGVVSAVMNDADSRRMRADRMRFAAASGSLLVSFAAGMTAMFMLANR
jgi:hypothetical protein